MERGYDGALRDGMQTPTRAAGSRRGAALSGGGYDHREYRRDGGRRDERDDRDRRARSRSPERSPKRSRHESPYRGGRGRDEGQYGAWQRWFAPSDGS